MASNSVSSAPDMDAASGTTTTHGTRVTRCVPVRSPTHRWSSMHELGAPGVDDGTVRTESTNAPSGHVSAWSTCDGMYMGQGGK